MHETSSVHEALGIDLENSEWQDFAMCRDEPVSLFFEQYESDPRTARLVDSMCSSCPARLACLSAGMDNKETGCWGGVYLTAGKPDKNKNEHKTPEDWETLRDLLNG